MLDEFVSKTENQTVNKVVKFLEDYKNRMTFDNLRIGERYVKGDVRLIVHIRFADKDYVAVFERSSDAARHAETADASLDASPAEKKVAGDFKRHPADVNEGNQQSVVLVGNVQIVDSPEHVIATFVRVGNVNGIYGTLRHALYSSMTLGLVIRGKLPDGKPGLLVGRPAVDEDELVSEMVEGASEVVDSVSGDEADINGRGLEVENLIERLSRLRIVLGFDSIRFAVEEPLPRDFYITDVLFGPFNFYADEGKSLVSGYGRLQ